MLVVLRHAVYNRLLDSHDTVHLKLNFIALVQFQGLDVVHLGSLAWLTWTLFVILITIIQVDSFRSTVYVEMRSNPIWCLLERSQLITIAVQHAHIMLFTVFLTKKMETFYLLSAVVVVILLVLTSALSGSVMTSRYWKQ